MTPFTQRPVCGGGCQRHHAQGAYFIFPQLFTAIKARTNCLGGGDTLTATTEQGKSSLMLFACLGFSFVHQYGSELFLKIFVLSSHKKKRFPQKIHSVTLTLDMGVIGLTCVLAEMTIMTKKMVTNMMKPP